MNQRKKLTITCPTCSKEVVVKMREMDTQAFEFCYGCGQTRIFKKDIEK